MTIRPASSFPPARALSRRDVLRALAAALGAPFLVRAARAATAPTPLAATEPMAQIHVTATGELLAVSRAGRLWQFDGRAWQARGEGLDPRAPIASGDGRIAGRAGGGGLWVREGGRTTQGSAPRLMPFAGLAMLPLGVIAVAAGADGRASVVRIEPASAGEWRETARGTEPVLPDARPLQVDLDGPRGAAGDGHIVVLGGPDADRYRHAVLGDAQEATRVLYLERHGLEALRTLAMPPPYVLEDIAPRPIDWQGATGLLTIRSGPRGAQVAVVSADPARRDALALAALGEPIGRPNRWLAPTTDGKRLVAIHTPHLAGTVHEYRYDGGMLRGRRVASGYSTHALGSREVDLAVWTGGALVLPVQDRRALAVVDVGAWAVRLVYDLEQPAVATRAWRAGERRGVAALLDDGGVVWAAVSS